MLRFVLEISFANFFTGWNLFGGFCLGPGKLSRCHPVTLWSGGRLWEDLDPPPLKGVSLAQIDNYLTFKGFQERIFLNGYIHVFLMVR